MYSSLSKHALHRLDLSLYLRLHHALQHVSTSKKHTLLFFRRLSLSSNQISKTFLKRLVKSCFTTDDTNVSSINNDNRALQIEELHIDYSESESSSPSPSECAEVSSESADCEKAGSDSTDYGWLRAGIERFSHSFRLIFAERDADESPESVVTSVTPSSTLSDEIDRRADAFIAGFREHMRLERTESDLRYSEMLARSLI